MPNSMAVPFSIIISPPNPTTLAGSRPPLPLFFPPLTPNSLENSPHTWVPNWWRHLAEGRSSLPQSPLPPSRLCSVEPSAVTQEERAGGIGALNSVPVHPRSELDRPLGCEIRQGC